MPVSLKADRAAFRLVNRPSSDIHTAFILHSSSCGIRKEVPNTIWIEANTE
jgi:hypothetical protein